MADYAVETSDRNDATSDAAASVERIVRLQELTAGLAQLWDRQAVADFVLGAGVASLGGITGSLCLLTPTGAELEIAAHNGYPPELVERWSRFPVDSPLPASDAVRTGAAVYVESPAERDRQYPMLQSAPMLQAQAYAIVPLTSGAAPPVGALAVGFAEPRRFSAEDRDFLEALASQCAIALERARLYEEAARGQRRMTFLADVSGLLAGLLDPHLALTQVAALAVPHLADWCAVHLANQAGTISQVAPVGGDPARAAEIVRLHPPAPVLATGVAELGPGALVLPMRARRRVLGALTLVNDGGRRFTDDDVELARELAARAAVAIDTARLFAERTEIARRLQDSLLPPTLPVIPGVELGARYRAAGEGLDVGGDFYDAFPVTPDRWMLAVGDVRGQGVDAAVITGLARHTIRSAAVAGGSPCEVLHHLNDILVRHHAEREAAGAADDWELAEPRFLTVLLASVTPTGAGDHIGADVVGADVVVCTAGHPLPLIRRADGTVAPAGAPGGLVGVMPEIELTTQAVALGPGDAMVAFTDGVIERHEGGRFVGEAGIARALASPAAEGEDAAGLARLVEATAVGFAANQPEDDMAVLVLRVSPTRP